MTIFDYSILCAESYTKQIHILILFYFVQQQARSCDVEGMRNKMFSGEKINITEVNEQTVSVFFLPQKVNNIYSEFFWIYSRDFFENYVILGDLLDKCTRPQVIIPSAMCAFFFSTFSQLFLVHIYYTIIAPILQTLLISNSRVANSVFVLEIEVPVKNLSRERVKILDVFIPFFGNLRPFKQIAS